VNFFGVLDGKLYTPESRILYGCTRNFLFNVIKDLGLEVVVGDIKKDFLHKFQEAFISSTTREIHPVVRIDRHVVGNGQPGPVTTKVMGAFHAVKTTLKN